MSLCLTEELTVAKLTLQLTEIPDEGLELFEEVQAEELGLLPEEALPRGPLSLSANLVKVGAHVHVEGVLEGPMVWECVRCLKEFDKPTEIPFTAEYQVPDPTVRTRERTTKDRRQDGAESSSEMMDQDDELYICTGDRVELAEMLREHVILSMPMQPLCHEQCRGLCPVCGGDRNEQACSCVQETQKNPFAILQERWKKSNS
jgi:uncharacterized protein